MVKFLQRLSRLEKWSHTKEKVFALLESKLEEKLVKLLLNNKTWQLQKQQEEKDLDWVSERRFLALLRDLEFLFSKAKTPMNVSSLP